MRYEKPFSILKKYTKIALILIIGFLLFVTRYSAFKTDEVVNLPLGDEMSLNDVIQTKET